MGIRFLESLREHGVENLFWNDHYYVEFIHSSVILRSGLCTEMGLGISCCEVKRQLLEVISFPACMYTWYCMVQPIPSFCLTLVTGSRLEFQEVPSSN